MVATVQPSAVSTQLEPEALSRQQTAQVLGIGVTTLHKLLREGEIRAIKVGARTIIPRAEVRRFLSEKQ